MTTPDHQHRAEQQRPQLNYDLQARHHFHCLDHDQQAQAIRRLAAIGYGDHTMAHATGLSVEMIRRLLAEVQHA